MPASRKANKLAHTAAPSSREDQPASWKRIANRKLGILFVCLAYLSVNGWFMTRHMIGDSQSVNAAYFFTWDMFPGYVTENTRRRLVGITKEGRYLQLFPEEDDYRTGIDGKVSRLDWIFLNKHLDVLREKLEPRIAALNADNDDPIVRVVLVEEFWPTKFNLPDDLYREAYGVEHPHRRYWRTRGRWNVADDGRLVLARGPSS